MFFKCEMLMMPLKLVPLLRWWKCLLTYGPMYGYFPNAFKTYLIHSNARYQFNSVQTLFSGTIRMYNIQRHVGAAIGTRYFTESYVFKKVKMWSETSTLSSIAKIHPHA